MKTFVKNGLSLSSLTLGTVQLGIPYGIANRTGMPDEVESFRILREAERSGIIAFDTAQAYGQSEAVLGSYFGGASQCTVMTKLLLQLDGAASEADLERHIIKLTESSLQKLQLNLIPIVMLHHASDLAKYGDRLVRACQTLIRNGYASKLGVSFGADPIELTDQYWSYVQDPIFEAVQLPINILDQRLIRSGLLQAMSNAGKIVFARSVFLQGLLLLDVQALPPKLRLAGNYIEQLTRIAVREEMGIAQLAVAFVRDLPNVDSLVIGAETPEQVRANIQLMQSPKLSEDVRLEINRLFSDVPEQLISPQLWN